MRSAVAVSRRVAVRLDHAAAQAAAGDRRLVEPVADELAADALVADAAAAVLVNSNCTAG